MGNAPAMVWADDGENTELLLGKYQIVEPLKVGGTASIYLALMHGENQFNREVVIKRPLPHLLANPEFRDMFVDEARVQSRLNHPNIVQVLDLVSKEHEVYLVLEYLSGCDLREVLQALISKNEVMPIDVATFVGVKICAGLHFAHEACAPDGTPLRLVHRDVSPKNIRLTNRGEVKLIDFGIARYENRLTETREGSVKGTLGFMSPEQIMGEALDRRSDVFAFGICFFMMLTGVNPFQGGNLKERVGKLLHSPIPKIRDFNPTIDEVLAAIVDRCLARDPDERYSSAEAVQIDLQNYYVEMKVVSPSKRLADFLENIFPDIHSPSERLREALTAISTLGGGSDAVGDAVQPQTLLSSSQSEAPLPRTVTDARAGLRNVQGPLRKERMIVRALVLLVTFLTVVTLWTLWKDRHYSEVVSVALDASFAKTSVDASRAVALQGPGQTKRDASIKVRAKLRRPQGKRISKSRSSKIAWQQGKLLKGAVRLSKRGRHEDAILLYQLAYGDGRNVPPPVFKNLALIYKHLSISAKVRACFDLYLDRYPKAPDRDRIRTFLASYPATKSVRCVSSSEARAARKKSERMGARIDLWLQP